MFYRIIRPLVRFIVWLINGHLHVHHKQRIPAGNYILVAPHRTWWEPILFALAASPKEFMFMAKIELFKNPILKAILTNAHAFPVDRKNPGPSVLKHPVKQLRATDLSLIMFPSGTRHSSELKGGALLIAKLSGKPLLPVVYQGSLTFSGLLKRQGLEINFGNPIEVPKTTKLNAETEAEIYAQLTSEWDRIDHELDPDFKYVAK